MTKPSNVFPDGSIFIRRDTPLPNWFRFNCEAYGSKWKRLFDANGDALDHAATLVGWRFSSIPPAIECQAFGLSRQSAMHRAINKVMDLIDPSGFNSLEVTKVVVRSWLGLSRADVVAHQRHLHATAFLKASDPFYRYSHGGDDFERIFWRAAEVEPEVKGV